MPTIYEDLSANTSINTKKQAIDLLNKMKNEASRYNPSLKPNMQKTLAKLADLDEASPYADCIKLYKRLTLAYHSDKYTSLDGVCISLINDAKELLNTLQDGDKWTNDWNAPIAGHGGAPAAPSASHKFDDTYVQSLLDSYAAAANIDAYACNAQKLLLCDVGKAYYVFMFNDQAACQAFASVHGADLVAKIEFAGGVHRLTLTEAEFEQFRQPFANAPAANANSQELKADPPASASSANAAGPSVAQAFTLKLDRLRLDAQQLQHLYSEMHANPQWQDWENLGGKLARIQNDIQVLEDCQQPGMPPLSQSDLHRLDGVNIEVHALQAAMFKASLQVAKLSLSLWQSHISGLSYADQAGHMKGYTDCMEYFSKSLMARSMPPSAQDLEHAGQFLKSVVQSDQGLCIDLYQSTRAQINQCLADLHAATYVLPPFAQQQYNDKHQQISNLMSVHNTRQGGVVTDKDLRDLNAILLQARQCRSAVDTANSDTASMNRALPHLMLGAPIPPVAVHRHTNGDVILTVSNQATANALSDRMHDFECRLVNPQAFKRNPSQGAVAGTFTIALHPNDFDRLIKDASQYPALAQQSVPQPAASAAFDFNAMGRHMQRFMRLPQQPQMRLTQDPSNGQQRIEFVFAGPQSQLAAQAFGHALLPFGIAKANTANTAKTPFICSTSSQQPGHSIIIDPAQFAHLDRQFNQMAKSAAAARSGHGLFAGGGASASVAPAMSYSEIADALESTFGISRGGVMLKNSDFRPGDVMLSFENRGEAEDFTQLIFSRYGISSDTTRGPKGVFAPQILNGAEVHPVIMSRSQYAKLCASIQADTAQRYTRQL